MHSDVNEVPVLYESMTEALCRLCPVNLAAMAMELAGILMVFESPQRSEKTIRIGSFREHGDV